MSAKTSSFDTGPTLVAKVLIWATFMAGGGLAGLLCGAFYCFIWHPTDGMAAAFGLAPTPAMLAAMICGGVLWLIGSLCWCRWIQLSPLSKPDLKARPSGMLLGIGSALGAGVGLVGGLLGFVAQCVAQPRFLDMIFKTKMIFTVLKFHLSIAVSIGLLAGMVAGLIWWLAAWQRRHAEHKKAKA